MSDRPFKVLGIQQIAIGGLDKSKLSPAAIERAVTFLRNTAGKEKAGGVSSVMADVAVRLDVRRLV